MRVAVCDDNERFLQELTEQIRQLPGLAESVTGFSDLHSLLFSVEAGNRYDAVLMDIDWSGEQAGMDAAGELYRLSPRTRVVYVTGYGDRYAQQIFLHQANLSGYLTKPVDPELLQANLRKVKEEQAMEREESLLLRTRGALLPVPVREILYLESSGHTTSVRTRAETYPVYERLGKLLDRLPDGFFQCHKSYVVNLAQIRRLRAADVLLKSGGTVPVSRSRLAELKKAYFRFMGQSF